MLYIISHYGNANSNHNELPQHSHQNGLKKQKTKKQTKTDNMNCWQGCEETGTLGFNN